MPRYYCDYCDTHLTHDSPTVRKTHCSGRKHKDNVTFYYKNWLAEQTQALINATTAEFKAIQSRAPHTKIPVGYPSGYIAPNVPLAGNVPIPGFPHMGLRPNLPPAGFHPVEFHPNLPPVGFHPVGSHPNLPPAGFHSAGLHPNMPQQGFYPHVPPPNMGMRPMLIPPMAGMGMQQSIHPNTITAPPYLKK